MRAVPPPPGSTRRHFPDGLPGPADAAVPAARGALIARLLEDGDRADLAWLGRAVGREALAAWVARHGSRRLSRRSRAFAAVALGVADPGSDPRAEALWPLA
jgi:hypothetical protein